MSLLLLLDNDDAGSPPPPVVCAYPLNDDGSLAANFSYAFAGPAVGADSQSMDYTASVAGTAILAPAAIFSTARFSRPASGSTVIEAEITVATGTAEPTLVAVISDAAGNFLNAASVTGPAATLGVLGATVASDGTVRGWRNGFPVTLSWMAGVGTVGATDKFGFALVSGANTQIGDRLAMTLRTVAADITGIWYGPNCATICEEAVPYLGVLYDSFTDTLGTAITAHTPDVVNSPASGSWAEEVGTFAIDSTTGTTVVRTSATAAVTGIEFQAGIKNGIAATSSLAKATAILFRRIDADNQWWFIHNVSNSGKDWQLVEEVGGTTTVHDTYVAADDTAHKAAVVFNGANITCYIDGVAQITYTSAPTPGDTETKVGFFRGLDAPPALVATDIAVVNSTDSANIPI